MQEIPCVQELTGIVNSRNLPISRSRSTQPGFQVQLLSCDLGSLEIVIIPIYLLTDSQKVRG